MDISLERILSLIPKKENGDYVRGAKAEFARAIGYDSGDIISMWVKSAETETPNRSYMRKLSDIALKCHVSLEWLKGETDDPRPGYVMTEFGSMPDVQMIGRASERMTPEQRQHILRYMQYMFPEAFEDEGKK